MYTRYHVKNSKNDTPITIWTRLKLNNSNIAKIDNVNYRTTKGFPQGDIYFILDPDSLNESNKTKFPNKGIYLIRANNNNFSSYDLFEWKCVMGGAFALDPILLPEGTQGKTITDSNDYFQTKTVEGALDQIGSHLSSKELILDSSTTNSTKKFKITVDDSGTLSATEITETT